MILETTQIENIVEPYLKMGVGVRSTVINWPNQLKAIVDSYRTYGGIVHGVQKDAIQNGWDARKYRKGRGWKFTFQLQRDQNHTFFKMTDQGTTGLTGRILKPEELEADLPKSERWGRFENVAFTKEPSPDFSPLGSRGRGKFIFVGASNTNTILYDSLREDGTYRFGFRTIKKTDSPIAAFDGDEGRKKIIEMTGGTIRPLTTIGTRVIVVDPIEDLVRDVKAGAFLRYVSETWWEIILKYDAKIAVLVDGKERIAGSPPEFVIPDKDSKDHKVWIRKNDTIEAAGRKYKVKKLHIVSSRRKKVPEDIRGISIQRGCMKICAIEPRYMPRDIAESIYGYITVGRDGESALREAEGLEHYSYDFRSVVPKAIKHYVEGELEKFAREKLGWGADIREIRRRHQRNAERRALGAINRIAKDLGLIGTGIGTAIREGGGGGRREIRVHFPDPEFPRKGDRRVNYGETLRSISAKVVNQSNQRIELRFKMYLRYYSRLLRVFTEEDLALDSSTSSDPFGPFTQAFKQTTHPDTGRYTIVARIVSLMEENKGEILDEKMKSFYLEEDPPSRGLFEKCEPVEYPKDYLHLMGEAVTGEMGGFIFQYNIKHPEYEVVADDEGELAAHLFRLMAHELCRIDLRQETPKLFDQEDVESPDAIMRRALQVLGDFALKYHLTSR